HDLIVQRRFAPLSGVARRRSLRERGRRGRVADHSWRVVRLISGMSQRPVVRVVAESAVAFIGLAFVVGAVLADHRWFGRRFLPTFFAPCEIYTVGEQGGRIAVAGLGAALALHIRPRVGRLVERRTVGQIAAGGARVIAAVLLAIGTSEWALRHTVFAL